jgi:hypothetical protein
MRSGAALVKPLACNLLLWHLRFMTKSDSKSREQRLAEALRLNLRRRKAQDGGARRDKETPASCPKSTD